MTREKPRWQYRFDNYRRAFSLLREAIELQQDRPFIPISKRRALFKGLNTLGNWPGKR